MQVKRDLPLLEHRTIKVKRYLPLLEHRTMKVMRDLDQRAPPLRVDSVVKHDLDIGSVDLGSIRMNPTNHHLCILLILTLLSFISTHSSNRSSSLCASCPHLTTSSFHSISTVSKYFNLFMFKIQPKPKKQYKIAHAGGWTDSPPFFPRSIIPPKKIEAFYNPSQWSKTKHHQRNATKQQSQQDRRIADCCCGFELSGGNHLLHRHALQKDKTPSDGHSAHVGTKRFDDPCFDMRPQFPVTACNAEE